MYIGTNLVYYMYIVFLLLKCCTLCPCVSNIVYVSPGIVHVVVLQLAPTKVSSLRSLSLITHGLMKADIAIRAVCIYKV